MWRKNTVVTRSMCRLQSMNPYCGVGLLRGKRGPLCWHSPHIKLYEMYKLSGSGSYQCLANFSLVFKCSILPPPNVWILKGLEYCSRDMRMHYSASSKSFKWPPFYFLTADSLTNWMQLLLSCFLAAMRNSWKEAMHPQWGYEGLFWIHQLRFFRSEWFCFKLILP